MKCFVLLKHEDQVNFETTKILLVKCSPYITWTTHVKIGTGILLLRMTFTSILLEEITDRVVFVKTKINFRLHIGEDNVLIISPLTLQ